MGNGQLTVAPAGSNVQIGIGRTECGASMAASNPVVTRDEFDRVSARVTALETSRATADADLPTSGDDVARHAGGDFVRQGEFRLFKWLGTFSLAAVLGGFALLYEQTSDVRIVMERLHTDVLREMHAQFESVREDMDSLREDMQSFREDMQVQLGAIRNDVAGVRERVVRLETLDGVEP